MANKSDRLPDNIEGRFYVDSSCISCVSCHSIAPDFFRLKNGNETSFVYRQPADAQETETCLEAMRECPVDAIGENGEDASRSDGQEKAFHTAIAEAVLKFPDRTFLEEYESGEAFGFRAFGEGMLGMWKLLEAEGVSPGDVVAIASDNSLPLAFALLSLIAYGAIAMPLNPKLTPVEMRALFGHSGARLLLTGPGHPETGPAPRALDLAGFVRKAVSMAAGLPFETASVAARIASPPGKQGGLLIYTSGTTGLPKGVLLSSGNIACNARTAIDALGLDEHHATLCLLPLFHTFAFLSDLTTMAFAGGRTVIQRTFDLARIADVGKAVRERGIRSFSAVPLIFEMLLRMDIELGGPGMRYCVSGAAPLPEAIREGFRKRYGMDIIPAYGLTECTCFCTISPPAAIVPGSVGRPAGVEIRVLDESENDLPLRAIGEIAVKGPSVFTGGYFRNDSICYTERDPALFKTGDLGYVDENGYVYVTGRKKNMVIRGGEKVYLEDVDRCLRDIPGIRDSATVKAGEGTVERVACFLVPEVQEGIDIASLRQELVRRIGAMKCPDRFLIVDSIPRTATNKVKIRELAETAMKAI